MRTCVRAVLLAVLITPATVRTANACSCMLNPPCAAVWRTDAVFIATAVENVEEHLGGHVYWTVQRLLVTRTLRGAPVSSVTLVPLGGPPEKDVVAASLKYDKVMAGANSCGYGLRVGEDYLVYATRTADGRWTTSQCSGTKPLAEARADLDYFATLPAAEPNSRVYGSVERTILDLEDATKTRNVPASGIDVALSTDSIRMTATTDAQGKLDVRVPPGEYRVAPVVPDSIRVYGGPSPITLAPRGCAPVSFSLISNGRIEGRVVHEDGRPVPRVTVGVIPANLPPGKRPDNFTTAPVAVTDAEGRYKIDAILPGTYLLAVNPRFGPNLQFPFAITYYSAGAAADPAPIEIADGERKSDFTITVRPLSETVLAGRVVFEEDEPVAGANIVVYPADQRGHVVSSGTTDTNGAFRVRVLAGVAYLIRAGIRTTDGYRETETQVFVPQWPDDLRISIRR